MPITLSSDHTVAAAVAVAALLACSLAPAAAGDDPRPADPGSPAAASSQRVFIDPATGRLVTQPATPGDAAAVTGVPAPSVSTRSSDLTARPSPVLGGGVSVDLQGRFQQETSATIDAHGDAALQRAPLPAVSRPTETIENRE